MQLPNTTEAERLNRARLEMEYHAREMAKYMRWYDALRAVDTETCSRNERVHVQEITEHLDTMKHHHEDQLERSQRDYDLMKLAYIPATAMRIEALQAALEAASQYDDTSLTTYLERMKEQAERRLEQDLTF